MRRFVVFVGPLVAAALAFACEDDPSSGGSPQFPEAGAFDSSRPTGDSSLPDAGQPQPDVVEPPKPVTVAVTSIAGAAVADVTVVFHDASGAVLETKKTDATGKALSAPGSTPAMASVVFGQGTSQREILTWTGVAGGDVLPVVAPPRGTLAELQITIPGQFTDAGGPTFNYYAQVGGCSAYSTIANEPITVFVEPYCYRGMGALLVEGSNGNDTIVAHALKKPLASVTDGGVATVTTDAWKFPPTDVTISLTNSNLSGRAVFQPIANGTAFPKVTQLLNKEASFKTVSGTFVEAYNAAIYVEGGQTYRTIGKRQAPAAAIALDGTQLPPEVTASSVDSAQRKRPKIDWTGNMGAMKGGVVRATWFQPSSESTTHWSIVVPANNAATGSVAAPALPATLEDMLPSADGGGTTWETAAEIVFVDSDVLPDYAAWRKVQALVLPSTFFDSGTVEQAVLPQNGSFRITHTIPPTF